MNLVKLLNAALNADLSKSEHQVFLVLLRQTLGYHKNSDALTLGAIAKNSGLRKDHAKKAVHGVINAGLYSIQPHAQYETLYSIVGSTTAATIEPAKPSLPPKTDVDALHYPQEINHQTRDALRPALLSLKSQDAQDILLLLAIAIQNGSIKTTPERLGYALIKAAKNGTLDRSALHKQPSNTSNSAEQEAEKAENTRRYQISNLMLEIDKIKSLYALAGMPIPAGDLAKIANFTQQLNQLGIQP